MKFFLISNKTAETSSNTTIENEKRDSWNRIHRHVLNDKMALWRIEYGEIEIEVINNAYERIQIITGTSMYL